MAKEPDTDGAPATTDAADKPKADMVDLIAAGSFHEMSNFQGKLLQPGDKFSAERSRAVELRANGLVHYADAEAEKAATAEDPPASEDGGVPVITTRSLRRAKQ